MKFLCSLFLMVALAAQGQYQTVNIGANPNDGTGDTLRSAFGKVNGNTAQTIADFAAVNASLVTLNAGLLAAEAHIVNSTNWPGYSFWVTNNQPVVNFGTTYANAFVASNSIYLPKLGLGSIDTWISSGFFRATNTSSLLAIGLSLDGANLRITGTGLNTLVNVDQSGVVTASNFVHATWKWVDVLQSGAAMASNPAGDPPVLTSIPGGSNYFGYAYYYDSPSAGDKSYFSIQGVHKFATTNDTNPDVWFEPHIHVMCTNMPATLSNVTFQLDLVYSTVFGRFTNGYLATKTFAFTNTYQHGVLSFGNVTNNALSGRSSVLFKGRIMRVQGGNGELGAANPVWVDSLDIHMPTQELGSTGQGGD